jgi:hypothetical protein
VTGGAVAGVEGVAVCVGLEAPCVCDTLFDCWPTDFPDPKRFEASALKHENPNTKARTTERNLPFIVISKIKSTDVIKQYTKTV